MEPEPVDEPSARPEPSRRRQLPWFTELLLAIIAVAMVQAFLVKPFGVPSSSMESTLLIGDRIVVNRLDSNIDRQDVIVFGHGLTWQDTKLPPDPNLFKRAVRTVGDVTGIGPSSTSYTVKRVIGLPGDVVGCCTPEGKLSVNGEVINEPYIYEDFPFTAGSQDCSSTPRSVRCFSEITVPAGNYLVLGDHRSRSADSVIGCRGGTTSSGCARYVPQERVVGPVVIRIWPLGSWGGIPGP